MLGKDILECASTTGIKLPTDFEEFVLFVTEHVANQNSFTLFARSA